MQRNLVLHALAFDFFETFLLLFVVSNKLG